MTNFAFAAAVAALFVVPAAAQADDDWTGFYVGIHIGTSQIETNGVSDSDPTLGLHAGYNHDFGQYILGGELSFDGAAEYTIGGTTETTETVRLKIKGGRVFGRTHLYGVVGYANFDDGFSRLDGYSVGVGVNYRATEKVLIGAEYLHDVFSRTGSDLKADTITLRASYRF